MLNKKKKVFLVGLALLILSCVAAFSFVFIQFLSKAPSTESQGVFFEVTSGKTLKTITNELYSQKLITNQSMFWFFVRSRFKHTKIKTGEYLLNRNMKPSEILSVLVSGKSYERSITIKEGLNIYEIAEIFQSAKVSRREDFLTLVTDKIFIKNILGEVHDSLEGYLYPETYKYTKYTTTKEIIRNMVNNFLQTYEQIKNESKITNLNRHQIVTLASIIEKETGASFERPIISSVFHNRLQKGMRLQTDPTVLYAKTLISGQLSLSISKADLSMDHPYNTYKRSGLPPGPIANAGKEALLAAIQPSTSGYLFFVSKNDGTHIFSSEYKSHERAVRAFQKDRQAREGKSWRDLKKMKDKTL